MPNAAVRVTRLSMSVRSAPAEIRRDPAEVVRRARELDRSRLDPGFESRVGQELQAVAVDVHVAIVRVRAKLDVGRVTDAAFEALRPGLDHRDVHRRVFRVRGFRIDLRLHAREISGRVEAPHVSIERDVAVRRARRDRAVVAHDRRIVFREAPRSRTCRSGTPVRSRARRRDRRSRARDRSQLRFA